MGGTLLTFRNSRNVGFVAHVFLRIATAVLKLLTYSLYASSTMDFENCSQEKAGSMSRAAATAAPQSDTARGHPEQDCELWAHRQALLQSLAAPARLTQRPGGILVPNTGRVGLP